MNEIFIDRLEPDCIGKRIDKFLSDVLEIPRNQIQNYIKEALISVCDKRVEKSYRIKGTECIKIIIPPPKELKITPKNADIKIIFEDDDVVVVDKPAGLVVHPGAACENVSVVSALIYRGVELSNIGAPQRPGVVHRIDKDTSGVLVLAKNDKAHFELAKQFFNHTIERRYIGIVSCHLKDRDGLIEKPIGRHPKNRKAFAVIKNGKKAKTYYRVIKKLANYDVVMFKLFTGRTHQIRVHMKYLGCPLIGDVVYGNASKNIERQALHAFKLGFNHPKKDQKMMFYSKLPEDMFKIVVGG